MIILICVMIALLMAFQWYWIIRCVNGIIVLHHNLTVMQQAMNQAAEILEQIEQNLKENSDEQ